MDMKNSGLFQNNAQVRDQENFNHGELINPRLAWKWPLKSLCYRRTKIIYRCYTLPDVEATVLKHWRHNLPKPLAKIISPKPKTSTNKIYKFKQMNNTRAHQKNNNIT